VSLWAVTSYFNPLGWSSRLRNYRCFRRHLAAPLATVEWHPDGAFELGPGDADLLVQVRGGELMWQKERLLNLAIARLPPAAEHVAWLDCDVVLERADWPALAARALEMHRAVQLFSGVDYLDEERTRQLAGETGAGAPPARPPLDGLVVSSAKLVAEIGPARLVEIDLAGHSGVRRTAPSLPRSPGIGWAARRSLLERTPFFDRAIVGSGDWLWMLAALGESRRWLSAASALGYSYFAGTSFEPWADATAAAFEGRLGYLEQTARHLFHGAIGDRRYKARHGAFARLSIDIERDIVESAPGGPWSFAGPAPECREFMARYFRERREDGVLPLTPG